MEAELRDIEMLWGTLAYGRSFVQDEASRGNVLPDVKSHSWRRRAETRARPTSHELSREIWYESDVRAILPAVQVPTTILSMVWQCSDHDRAHYVASLIPGAELREIAGDSWTPETARSFAEEVRRVAGVAPPAADLDRVLAAVLFTDIVGSTEQLSAVGDAEWRSILARHDERARAEIERHRGRYVDSTGDGILAIFDGPARAVRCAQAIGASVRDLGIQIRAGVHTGEVELDGGAVRGIAVHIGARVAALGGPSEVLVSQTVKDLVAGSGLTFEDAGEHELKGVPDRWHLYRVVS